MVSILSLTIWFWFSEPQNKPFLLIGKPIVSRFLPFLSFCFTFEYQTKVSQVFQFEFLLFYKNYIYFCWRFFGNVLPDIETENKVGLVCFLVLVSVHRFFKRAKDDQILTQLRSKLLTNFRHIAIRYFIIIPTPYIKINQNVFSSQDKRNIKWKLLYTNE